MSCGSTTLVMESFEEPVFSTSSAKHVSAKGLRRRRHSSFHPLAWHAEQDDLQLLVCYLEAFEVIDTMN
jgi:adiponectin receptor